MRSFDVDHFVSDLFDGKADHHFICTWQKISDEESKSVFHISPSACADYVKGQTDIYVSLSVYDKRRRSKDGSVGIPGLWLDVDSCTDRKPHGATPEQIKSLFDKLPTPTLIVNSGGGFQPY